jgi:hypothetical protein
MPITFWGAPPAALPRHVSSTRPRVPFLDPLVDILAPEPPITVAAQAKARETAPAEKPVEGGLVAAQVFERQHNA